MHLRLRLIVAFFLLSVVPLGVVTSYTYTSNASAMREAAGREAELLAGELGERMKLVTAQLSQRFEQLMDIPASAGLEPPAMSAGGTGAATKAGTAAAAQMTAAQTELDEVEAKAAEATRVARQLGEVAVLLNNIEVRGFRPRRGGASRPRVTPNNGTAAAESGAGQGAEASPPASADPRAQPRSGEPRLGPRGSGGRASSNGQSGTRNGARRSGASPPAEPTDPSRVQIDLGPMRREILQQIFPERERWDQLSQPERELILARANERMLGIQQGMQILQEKASEQAAAAKIVAMATEARRSSPVPVPSASASPAAPARAAPLQRRTALSGSHMDVRVMQDGEVIGQVNADINLPNLLATVFTTTRRDKGEVPFAVDRNAAIYTPTDADRDVINALNTTASRPETPPGTVLLPNWVVVTTADPTGSELKFGIARPMGDALEDLRRSSTRNAGLGLALIGLALIGIIPLSSRLTRNLSRLSDGVNQIARGDYSARVDVSSHDEIGRLAGAFNRMAADVERHQRTAVEQERLRRELELGRQIQHDMLPNVPLRLGLTEIRGVSVPATEVGGDFFNYFQTSSGKIALLVGDVSGKGVGAALLMANIQASLRARLALGQDLASVARELDADIGASTPGTIYATLFVGLLDLESHRLDYVNAGHNPPFVLSSGSGLERMESTGMPIGLLPGHAYSERCVSLAPGDVLFFYTDGCVEAENESGEMFGTERLEAVLINRLAGSCDDMLVRIEQELRRFRSGREPFDDATMMVVQVG